MHPRANNLHAVARAVVAVLACVLSFVPTLAAHADDPPPADDLLPRTARVEDAAALGVGRIVPDLTFTPLRGEPVSISALLKDRKALVLAVTGATCPVAMKYTARLASLEAELALRGVTFAFINGVDAELDADMARQVQQYRLKGPYIPDRDRALCKALGVRTTTEVFVLDASRTLVYRGAIDDQFGINVNLDAPRNQYLRDAIDATLADGGVRPRIRATYAPGCLVSIPSASPPTPSANEPITYIQHIAWILAENCVSCHRPGGAAPFTLDSYESVIGRAKMVQAVVGSGLMPPWHGATHAPDVSSPWVSDRSLSQHDRDTLLAWLRTEPTPLRGPESPLPVLPPISRTWAIGEPDLLVTSSGFRLPAQGGLQHARVMVGFTPTPLTEDKWVSSLEFRPVESNSIHHALIWILAPGDALPKPDEIPAKLELLGTYSPGDTIIRYPSGVARRIKAGSIFLVDLYARPMGKEAISALRIAARWSTSEPTWRVRSIAASADALAQPKGTDRSTTSLTLAFPASGGVGGGARLLALTPEMRSHGRAITITETHPGAPARPLLSAPAYDFRWQIRYELAEPRDLALGTVLTLRGEHDPGAGPIGSGGTDEALLLSVEVLEPVVGVGKR